MCGICGIVSESAPPDIDLVKRMVGRISHRGPDGSGCFRDRRAALGHARLAIIDTVGGVQPLSNEDRSIWITFNGEIFNYVELANELRGLGHVMRTSSDTEVIIHAWEEWREGCFERLNGQWAFALWDRKNAELVMSRDRMGVRPLYYTNSGGRFLFASEIKAIFADASVERAFDPAGLAETFTFWSTVAPRTPYSGIRELEPGHWALLRNGKLETKPYWRISFPLPGSERTQSLAENGTLLRKALVEATRLRFLRSDVPVGAYLSGGIDSSITAAIVARHTSARLRTFSLRFAEEDFDEGPYQAEMVRRLGSEHSDVVVSADDIAAVFPEVVWHAEAPILRAAPAPLFLLSKLVRESGYKVVVTGEGADEVLAGYDLFREAKVRLFQARDTLSVKRSRAYELLYPWLSRSPGKSPAFARAFFGKDLDISDPAFSHRPRWEATRELLRLLSADMREAAAVSVEDDLVARMPPESASWEPVARAQWLEMSTLLPGYILSSQGDRMLMANSVEGRFPFLDPEVVSLANGMPSWHKLMALDEKHILKREFADMIPPSIIERPKQPYRAPDAASFFSGSKQEWQKQVLSESRIRQAGIFEPKIVAELFSKCDRVAGRGMGNTDNMRVLAVLSTMLAYGYFVEGDGSGDRGEEPQQPMTIVDLIENGE